MEIRDEMQKVALEWLAYGYRKNHGGTPKAGFAVNHKRVLRMMREDNLLCVRRRRFVVTTESRHNRSFTAGRQPLYGLAILDRMALCGTMGCGAMLFSRFAPGALRMRSGPPP